jgi:hypothetical protein
MGVDALVEDEDRLTIERLSDPTSCIERFLMMTDANSTSLLQYIDLYGDTTFNQLQIPDLRSEVETALSTLSIHRLSESREATLSEAIRLNWDAAVIAKLRDNLGTEESLAREADDVRVHITRLLELLDRSISEGPHTYVRFVGD